MYLTITACKPLREAYDAPEWRITPGDALGPDQEAATCAELTQAARQARVRVLDTTLAGYDAYTAIIRATDPAGTTRDYLAACTGAAGPCHRCAAITTHCQEGVWFCEECRADLARVAAEPWPPIPAHGTPIINVWDCRCVVERFGQGPALNWEALEDEAEAAVIQQGGAPNWSGIYACPPALAAQAIWPEVE